jgi:hypothetical protein
MIETELSRRLAREPVPGEQEAAERAWEVVSAAFATRERVPRSRRRWRPVLALAVVAAVAAAAVTPPGRALVERIREAVGPGQSEPKLLRLPAPGVLLVKSAHGPWVVQRDGSKRLLGAYQDASWSPHGRFVVATNGRKLVALEPGGEARWEVPGRQQVTQARWAPSGFRIAYREGNTLRVVIGNGQGDRLFARRVAPIAPAWRPRPTALNVLAYAALDGSVHVVDVDSRRELLRTTAGEPVTRLVWSGRFLLVLRRGGGQVYEGKRVAQTLEVPKGHVVLDAAFGPRGGLVYSDFDPKSQKTSVIRDECAGTTLPCLAVAPYSILRYGGRLDNLTWSPNGRWLLVAWPSADQWLFLRFPRVGRIVVVSNVVAQFDPGGTGPRTFPRVAGWVKPEKP